MSLVIDAPTRPTVARAGRRAAAGGFVVIAACLAAGLLPLFWHFMGDLYARKEYAFFLMLPGVAGLLTVKRLGRLPAGSMRTGSWLLAAPLLAASVCCLVGGAVFYVRWAAAPALILMIAGAAFRLGGLALLRCVVPGFVLLLVAMPPSVVNGTLMVTLRRFAVAASGRIFDLVGLPNVVTGTVIEVPGRRLLVEEACSGVNSVMAIVAFSLLYAFLRLRSPLRMAGLAVAGAVFAMMVNVVRIAVSGYALARFGVDLFVPSLHELIGLLMFALALGLLMSTDQLLDLLTPSKPNPAPPPGKTIAAIAPRLRIARPGVAWIGFAIAFVAVGIWSGVRLYGCWPASQLQPHAVFIPPRQVGPWTIAADADAAPRMIESMKALNHTWVYQNGSSRAEVSFTYPFNEGIHDCSACYVLGGWQVQNRVIDSPGNVTTADLIRPGSTFGHVVFASFDETGQWLAPIPSRPASNWLTRRLAYDFENAWHLAGYEVQVLGVDHDRPITAAERRSLLDLFVVIRADLRRQMLSQVLPAAGDRSNP